MKDNWKCEVDSMVSSQYVYPLYPKKGNTVTLRIKLPSNMERVTVFLMAYVSGEFLRVPCTFQQPYYGVAEIDMPEKEDLFWYFALVLEKKAYYYSQLGLTGSVPSLMDSFRLIADLQIASWVSSATCYQIFPDRFKNGDPSCGAKEGQYMFDGGKVTTHAFTERPLDFEQGRCLDFFNGDLKGIADSLDHFKEIGVDTLYLNPIGVSRTTHRYDCCDFFHIDEKLGGDEAFAQLCQKLHEHGMKIIIDISINHTGTEHPWLKKAKEDTKSPEASYYYTLSDGSIACWQDVPTLPQLNYTSKDLRILMYQGKESAMRIFLREPYNQDGWRLDVANEVGRAWKRSTLP
ncbi:alpha-amylase family glycosyl hydrolase [uncultured Sphaerochaeta sp.]|uniref:alpha-amylase family glycosyl hydrolase n=1 Tax=uncultured Sphaerochaeta sp. TaxID=886478 RepID=UPI002A0A6299|nr:alpha-amylase family glycosyl hydrolase [uncultured Sphaerochaeta sp.]